MGACRRTSNRQEHKITQRAGPEQDTIFHLHVTACRRRGSHCQDERLAWVASRGQGTSCSSSFVSKVLGANCKRANNFLPVAHKFTMCTDRKQPLNLPVMRMRMWIRHVYCHHQYIKILVVCVSVCVCVRDGCGCAFTNFRFVCKIITCS